MKTLKVISCIFVTSLLLSGIFSIFQGKTSSASIAASNVSQSKQVGETGQK